MRALLAFLLVALHAAPNPAVTPGLARYLNREQVCSVQWGLDRRHVTEAMKRQVAAAYGLPRASIVARGHGPCCEFDHLIPRELGGADDVRNLWPQRWTEAHVKDQEENRLHRAVCAGTLTLQQARDQMRQWGQ